jgi:hypothetical protein
MRPPGLLLLVSWLHVAAPGAEASSTPAADSDEALRGAFDNREENI